jgi:hypothetical protein
MDGRTVEFRGETYRIADKIGLAPLMRFGKLARSGADSGDMAALAVMYDVIDQCFASTCDSCGSWDQEALFTRDEDKACCADRKPATVEFDRFMDTATEQRWDHEEILEVVGKVMEVLSERPTGRRPASSAEPSTVRPNFEDASSLRAQRRLEEAGRADLAVAVLNAREHRQTQRAG